MYNKKNYFLITLLLVTSSLACRDILLEFKGAYFLGTNSIFRKIYDHGGALYGPEVTFNLGCHENLYGFASIDVLQKHGRSIGLCSPTKVTLIPLGLGLKYLIPFCYGDFYVGLGIQPTYVRTKDCSPYVIPKNSKWGCGGIAKIGTFFDLPHNLLLDIFIDQSFVTVPFHKCKAPTGFVSPRKAKVSGTSFGVGFGYRFN